MRDTDQGTLSSHAAVGNGEPKVDPHRRLDENSWAELTDPNFLAAFRRRQEGPVEAVPTPLPSWNQVCGDDGGFEGPALGWFVTIGGNPGFGKSLAALNCAYTALREGRRIGYLSYEMSEMQLAGRFYALATGTPIRDLQRGGQFDPEAFQQVRKGMEKLQERHRLARFYVNRETYTGVDDLGAAMTILHRRADCRVFIIDYLQLVGVGDEESVIRQMGEVVSVARDFAVRHEVLVIGLSQFNRRTSADYSQSPMVQGLYGGQVLEAASDQVVLLDHSRYQRHDRDRSIARSWAIVGKNRHGPRTEIPILWNYNSLRIREGLEDELHEWPEGDR